MDLHVVLVVMLLRFGVSVFVDAQSATCPSLLREDQAMWRTDPLTYTVELNRTKVFCVKGEKCDSSSNNASNSTSFGYLIHITGQEEDRISLKLSLEDEFENETIEILIGKSTGWFGCTIGQPMMAINHTNDVILDDRILEPGNQILIVKTRDILTGCHWLWKLNVSLSHHQCSKSKDSNIFCSGTGYCGQRKDTGAFTCSCCPGYVGKYCEERDACYGNPCQHGGFCVDIAEGLTGNTFQCLCPHGYRGRSCEGEVSICDKKPCLNEGTCHGNQTHYSCLCPKGFTGPDCGTNVNECLSNPCIHGVCEDGIGGYKCYCLPGYGGDHCEFEYDECDSSPCINGGACEDLVAAYRCHCGAGYKGSRCQIKVDLCTPNPCPSPAQCVDRGNNYSCICHPGHSNPGCTQHYDPCYPNPCQHGGTCWPSLDSYFCSCPPTYTGDLCEEGMLASQPLSRTLEDPGEPQETKKPADEGAPVDHWHNLYIAGTMLTLAGSLVVLGAVVCHCRMHKTYLTLTRKLSRSCSEIKQQRIEEPGKFTMNLRGNVSERRNSAVGGSEGPTLYEASSVDGVTENLDAPLIV